MAPSSRPEGRKGVPIFQSPLKSRPVQNRYFSRRLKMLASAQRRMLGHYCINVYLEKRRRMICRPPLFQRHNPNKAKPAKIEAIDECVNRANRIVLGHVV